jgi:SAM-dependent methyltransferase
VGAARRIGEDGRVTARAADDVRHPIFARLYAATSPGVEGKGAAEHRDEMLAGIAGRVLEMGAGNGLNFAHYPAAVTGVLAVEPEPYLRERASREAAGAPVPITVVAGVADALPAEDGAFDAAVASLVLCTVPDQPAALAELRRVLRPGGALHFYEHVVAAGRLGAAQRWLDRSGVWPRIGGGCHSARDTVAAIAANGFAIERCRRFDFPIGPVPVPHVVGVARRG